MNINAQIELRNFEQEKESLRNDCIESAAKLTNLNQEIKNATHTLQNAKKEYADAEDKNADEKKKIEESWKDIEKEREKLEEEKKRHERNNELLIEQEKNNAKKLNWTNTRIFNAEQHLEELNRQADEIMVLIDAKCSIEDEISSLSKMRDEKREIMNAEISELQAILDAKEIELKDILSSLHSSRKELSSNLERADKAKIDCENYTRDLQRKMNDWEILKARLVIKYKEVYPELELKL